MALARDLTTTAYGDEFPLSGAVPGSGPYDISGTQCFTLNASGPAGRSPRAPTHPIEQDRGHMMNLMVMNEHGVDMFADAADDAKAVRPHGASDGTVHGNRTVVVRHPDYAWRCHGSCGCAACATHRSGCSR